MPRIKQAEPQDVIGDVKPILVPSRVRMTDGRMGTIVGVLPGITRGGTLHQDKMRYGVIIDGVSINGSSNASVWLTYGCFDFSEQEQEEPKGRFVKKKAAVKKGVRR